MTKEIKGVEIFRSGIHNSEKYTEADLDSMVDAFNHLDYRPALKLGHSGPDKPGAPAYGWVAALRKVGSKLVADFTHMHESVVEAIRRRAFDTVSAEIYFDLKRNGKTYPRALKAVALLGAEIPAVAGLVPLHKMEFRSDAPAKVHTYEQRFTADADMKPSASVEIDRRVRDSFKHQPLSAPRDYAGAIQRILEDDKALSDAYDAEINASKHPGTEPGGRLALNRAAGDEIDRLTLDHMKTHGVKDYAVAMQAVLAEPANADAVRGYEQATVYGREQTYRKNHKARIASHSESDDTAAVRSAGRIRHDAGAELDKLAMDYLKKNPTLANYETALNAVMLLYPKLAQQYTGGAPVG